MTMKFGAWRVCAAVAAVWRGRYRRRKPRPARNATPNGRPTRQAGKAAGKTQRGLRRGVPRPAGAGTRDARQGPVQDRGRGQDIVPDRQRRVGQPAVEGLSHQRQTRVTARPRAAPTCARRKARQPASARRKAPRSRRDPDSRRTSLADRPRVAIHARRGRLAQLVERLLYTQDVGGSSPSPPTSLRACGASGQGGQLVGKAAYSAESGGSNPHRAPALASALQQAAASDVKASIRRQPEGRRRDAKEVPA